MSRPGSIHPICFGSQPRRSVALRCRSTTALEANILTLYSFLAVRGRGMPQKRGAISLQQLSDVRRIRNATRGCELLMIALDPVRLVNIIHHHAHRFRNSAAARIGAPIDAIESSAVSQMEARHGIFRSLPAIARRQVA